MKSLFGGIAYYPDEEKKLNSKSIDTGKTNVVEWEDLRTERIYIRVTAEEKETFKKLAKLQHLSVSDLVRYIVLSKYFNEIIK